MDFAFIAPYTLKYCFLILLQISKLLFLHYYAELA